MSFTGTRSWKPMWRWMKTRIGTERIEVHVRSADEFDAVVRVTQPFAANPPTLDAAALLVTLPIIEGTRLMDVMRALDAAGVDAVDLHRREHALIERNVFVDQQPQ